MTYEELSKLPIGTIVVDDADKELGCIESGRFFNVIQWDNGCRTVLNNEGSGAKTATPYRPAIIDHLKGEKNG